MTSRIRGERAQSVTSHHLCNEKIFLRTNLRENQFQICIFKSATSCSDLLLYYC